MHDLCDELGLQFQVDITAGAARAWTYVGTSYLNLRWSLMAT
ncbi:MAG TPA: hypothetical protein VKH63_06095 [Candidatus Acidoferrum sp.]|nr:hypothetical protein [Candidatus Acidoferrum sp.]